ncbi:MAG: FlgD immunoglobulin-like domain containing protein [Rubricoccaceae bacterium]|nr:FlgD immunoglobulin-like domain containing protein [Rubricoccaceae bacterium]
MPLRAALLFLLAAVALPCAAQSAEIDGPGPFPVGHTDVRFDDAVFGQGRITGRVYYPAVETGTNATPDPTGGPFPLVGFQHGFLGSPDGYDLLCSHIASWGFVVASTGTESGFFPDQRQFARDTRSFLYWVEDQSEVPGGLFEGMTDDGPWAAVGHSMGGGVLALLVGYEPRVETIVGLQSAYVGDERIDFLRAFPGNHYQLAGSADGIVPADQVRRYFEAATSARRSVYFEGQGLGHSGPTDEFFVFGNELPAAEQQRLHRLVVTGLLRAEMKGEEDLYAELLGEGVEDDPLLFQTRCLAPPLWVRGSEAAPDALVVGTAGAPGATARLGWSDEEASIPTPFGLLGIPLDPERVIFAGAVAPDGTAEALLPTADLGAFPAVFVQGLVRAGARGRLTRVAQEDGPFAAPRLAASAASSDVLAAPNPFAARTEVRFTLAAPGPVEAGVYDALGRRVRVLADRPFEAGPHVLAWDGRDDAGRAVASGVYLCALRVGTTRQTVPLVKRPSRR